MDLSEIDPSAIMLKSIKFGLTHLYRSDSIFVIRIIRMVNELHKTFHRLFKIINFKKEYQQKSCGLNYLQLHTLEKIYKEKAMKTLDISKALDISPSTLIGVLDELERRSLITRQRQLEDKRVVLVVATKLGEEIVAKHFQEDELFLNNLLNGLSKEEQEQLRCLLDKITDKIVDPEILFKSL